MNDTILSALSSISVSELSYQEWINVGFALKTEGYGCEVWDQWSRNDSRYHEGECRKKWQSFSGSGTPITGATIVQMAKDHGWRGFDGDGAMDWDDVIEYDGDCVSSTSDPKPFNPVQEFRTYLKTLFRDDEYVGYVVSAMQDKDGKWKPCSSGCFDRTAGDLISLLDRYPEDLGATIGDWNPQAGAWIRFNALDGKGVKNTNVVSFRYALVESDSMALSEQERLYRQLNLPIAVLVSSGGKSLHAIVRVDADDLQQYRERVDYLYSFLKNHGLEIDIQNRNPSRLSRLPGVTRGDKVQRIEAVNIGCPSWEAWLDWIEGQATDLPATVNLADFRGNVPTLPEELISGVLRCGHKMIISGPSKAGKSFLLMELCVSLAEGSPWLGFSVRQGRVLYVNLEIDPASCINRFMRIYEVLSLDGRNMANITIWNLRGHAVPLDRLVPKIVRKIQGKGYEAVIIDPIYKVITGDENSASDMGAFCNQFDRICNETGCSAIYCHHHSKGAQGSKKAIDRASGSGVFARDPDAQLDIIELDLSDDIKNNIRDGFATAWRMEGSLREFPSFKPVNFWFEYPVHRVDNGNLESAPSDGSPEANLAKSSKRTTAEERHRSLATAFDLCCNDGKADIKDMAEYMGTSVRSMKRYVEEFKDEYTYQNGLVFRA